MQPRPTSMLVPSPHSGASRCPSMVQALAYLAVVIAFGGLGADAAAELSAQKVLSSVYGRYDKQHACWIATEAENQQRYCMKLDHAETISTDTGPRLYILAAGNAVDAAGAEDGGHVTPGLVGAFVVAEQQGQTQILHGKPNITVGANGQAPRQWRFVKLGPSDYWGWHNVAGDCHQGYCGSRHIILAPYGKTIKNVAGFVASFNDGGACGDTRCAGRSTDLDSKLDIHATQIHVPVFPLRITVTGRDKGRKLAPKTWILPFNPAKWAYTQPKDWPLAGRDF